MLLVARSVVADRYDAGGELARSTSWSGAATALAIAALADAGQIAPRVDPRTFAFTAADVDAAHAALTDGRAAGKLVISVQ